MAGSNFQVLTAWMAFSSSPIPRLAYFNVARLAIWADDQPQHTGSLIFGLPGFFRVFRLRLINRLGRGDAAAYPEYPATRTTAAALAYARPGAHTNSAPGTRTNATPR